MTQHGLGWELGFLSPKTIQGQVVSQRTALNPTKSPITASLYQSGLNGSGKILTPVRDSPTGVSNDSVVQVLGDWLLDVYSRGGILNPKGGEAAVLEGGDQRRGERDVGDEGSEGGSQNMAGLLSGEFCSAVSSVPAKKRLSHIVKPFRSTQVVRCIVAQDIQSGSACLRSGG